MKLDLSALRYLSNDDIRVLTAIEMGMRNHEIVPVELIGSIAKLKRGNINQVVSNLLKHKLVEHSNVKYDGYSLNFLGYDFLAIHTLMKRGILVKMGPKLGVGKESDVHICYVNAQYAQKVKDKEITDEEYNKLKERIMEENQENEEDDEENEKNEEDDDQENEGNEYEEDEENEEDNIITNANDKELNTNPVEETNDLMTNKFEEELQFLDIPCHIAIIKIARLGRTSFRAVKNKRDYVKNKSHYNWLYLSRISAINEYKFLTGLFDNGYSVPKPYDQNRHVVLMQYIPSFPLCRIEDLGDKEKAYNDLISIIISLARKGLLHGDFNEFNILVQINTQKIFFIDFPQMISVAHQEAEKYFYRDLECINKFFKKKFGMTFDNNTVDFKEITKHREDYLDVKFKAYGHEIALNSIADEEKKKLEYLRLKRFEEEEDEESEDKIIDNNMGEEMDLDFNDEIEDKQEINKNIAEKIEITTQDIKHKLKRLLLKEKKKYQTRKGKDNKKDK